MNPQEILALLNIANLARQWPETIHLEKAALAALKDAKMSLVPRALAVIVQHEEWEGRGKGS